MTDLSQPRYIMTAFMHRERGSSVWPTDFHSQCLCFLGSWVFRLRNDYTLKIRRLTTKDTGRLFAWRVSSLVVIPIIVNLQSLRDDFIFFFGRRCRSCVWSTGDKKATQFGDHSAAIQSHLKPRGEGHELIFHGSHFYASNSEQMRSTYDLLCFAV